MGGVLGGSTIYITNATKEYRKYSTLEKCLEEKGHEIIFMILKKLKNKTVLESNHCLKPFSDDR